MAKGILKFYQLG